MSNYVFSPSENSFYSMKFYGDYLESKTWPSDGVKVSDDTFNEYAVSSPPVGKVRGVNSLGMPCWIDIPPLSKNELIAAAEVEKVAKVECAQQRISLWQTQLMLGMISDADKAKLIEWMHYITALQAVDTSTAPDINWPQQPAE